MPQSGPTQKWRTGRRLFRWFRIALLLGLLALVIGVIWLNQVGLPGFLKSQVQSALRARGIELEFSRLRLRWYRGIVAEKVSLGGAAHPDGPQLTANEVTVRIRGAALRRGRLEVNGLQINEGRLVIPLLVSNEPPYRLVVDGIQSELLLLHGDLWELASLQGRALGCEFSAAGTLANASALPALVRQLVPPREPGKPPRPWQAGVRRVAREIEAARFATPPELSLQLHADAANTNQFRLELALRAADARTRWGSVRNLSLSAPVTPVPGANGLAQADVTVQFNRFRSDHVQLGPTKLDLRAVQSLTNPLPLRVEAKLGTRNVKTAQVEAADLSASATTLPASQPDAWRTRLRFDVQGLATKQAKAAALAGDASARHTFANFQLLSANADLRVTGLETEWGSAKQAGLAATSVAFSPDQSAGPRDGSHPARAFKDRFLPSSATAILTLDHPQTRWATADVARVEGAFALITNTPPAAAPGFWTNLWPLRFTATTTLTNLQSPKIELAGLSASVSWAAPALTLSNVQAALYGGSLTLDASLDAASRRVQALGSSDFNVHRLQHLLTTNGQRWLGQHAFARPPEVVFSAWMTLPVWTNRAPDWKTEVLPTLLLEGGLRAGEGAFRTVPYVSARSTFRLTNSLFEMPDLVVVRPEGEARLTYRSDIFTRDYYWKFLSTIDPRAIEPLLETEEQRKALRDVAFTGPPRLAGELWGRWYARELTGGHADVALTNFVVRGGAFSNATATLLYTNLVLRATNVVVRNGEQFINADGVTVDIPAERVFFTNVFATFDPYLVARVIGPKTAEAVEPYRFASPPTIRLRGSVPFRDEKRTDLHFEVSGGRFNWWKCNLGRVTGEAHWVTNTLLFTNVQARASEGTAWWNAVFDFSPPVGNDFRFELVASNLNLRALMADLHSPTNRMEGRLDGMLTIAAASTGDWKSWQGFGYARLRDGYLWDVPLVGIFSPLFNAVLPGLGKSPIREATGDFFITNSVIHTRNLELKAPALRLQYRGTVDFAGNVDAEVEAELLRDAWLVGRIFSLAMAPITKLFVYKVTGTISEPKREPLYVPRLLLMPLQPFKTLRELLTDEKPPPEKKPEP